MLSPVSMRRYAHTPRPYRVSTVLSLLGLVAIVGCGGGGGGSHTTNPPPTSEISGTITDATGAPIVGATVHFGSQTATSTQLGAYVISNVSVPSGQTSLVGNVTATATVNGTAYSGQNQVEILSTDPLTRNTQIVLSPTSTQGSIIGVVLDSKGNRIAGARVFANQGPYTGSNGAQFLGNLGSFNTTSRSDGGFTLPAIPPASSPAYVVTASLAGYTNQTATGVVVQSATSTSVTLTLGGPVSSPSSATVATPTGLFAQAFTTPINPTRAVGGANSAGYLNAIRQYLLKKRGLLAHRAAATQKVMLRRSATRDTPANSLIETDVFWDYPTTPSDNILGYDIFRATSITSPNFGEIALVRDPLADRFADNDPALTPDQNYYYSISTVDTINFPAGNVDASTGIGESPAATPFGPVAPLNVLSLVSPTSGSTVGSATPTFQWNAVNRAALYQVLVYDQFPAIQSDTNPDGVSPIWVADFTATSGVYPTTAPALVSGHTYYWAVVAQDNATSELATAFSISPLQTFVAH